MKKTLGLLAGGFESSSQETEQFNEFCRVARAELKKELETNIGIKDFIFSKGHFYFSGFFTTNNNKHYYYSVSDVRGSEHNDREYMLIRTAKDYKDYTGGSNNNIEIKTDMFKGYTLPTL